MDIPLLLSIKIGDSILSFKYDESETHYHYAFNIPKDSIAHVLPYLETKIDLISSNGSKVIDFSHWNAKALFFEDGNGNLAEVIERASRAPMHGSAFSVDMIQNISEIGIPLTNIEPVFDLMNHEIRLEKYDGNLDRFCAIGTEEGLFICINKNIKTWYPIDKEAIPSYFEAIVTYMKQDYIVTFDGLKVAIESIKI